MLIQLDLTKGTDWEKASRRQIKIKAIPCICLACTVESQSGSLMCVVYGTDTQNNIVLCLFLVSDIGYAAVFKVLFDVRSDYLIKITVLYLDSRYTWSHYKFIIKVLMFLLGSRIWDFRWQSGPLVASKESARVTV